MLGKVVLIGIIGIMLILLAGTVSAHSVYGGTNCGYCHVDYTSPPNLTANGTIFSDTHKFNGTGVPAIGVSCTHCHVNPPTGSTTPDLGLLQNGSFYNSTHRYNDTTLASVLFSLAVSCYSCHVDVNASNFTPLTGASTYLTSSVCKDCHKKKYDDWYGTMHRVMLTKNTSGAIMNLTVPDGKNWTTTNISYMIVYKTSFIYLNENGNFFKIYDVINQTNTSYSGNYTCGSCHTTGYNATGGNQSGLSGIAGTWKEEGIACENCHGPGGNGHNVTVDPTGNDCLKCHNDSLSQGSYLSSGHAPPLHASNNSCSLPCHSPYDKYKNRTITRATAINVACSICHNPHNTSDDKYRELLKPSGFNATNMSIVAAVKLSFFNGTASNISRSIGSYANLTAGNDIYDILTTPSLIYERDSSYLAPINVTGPVSEVLCSKCHYNHGLAHIAEVNLTHARFYYPAQPATCVDCHMSDGQKNHSFNLRDAQSSCSGGPDCHITSDQNLSKSNWSIVPVEREWAASLHNDKVNGHFYNNGTAYKNSSCSKCHSPFNWNPANESGIVAAADFKGITCAVCHNIHDMGDSIKKSGQVYSWYNRDAILNDTRYKANYTLMANTTELCGNCHSNIRIGNTGPGYGTPTLRNPTGIISPHGFPAKDLFVGSWKQTNATLKFECITCHMYINKTNATGGILNDTEKTIGHSFKVNTTGLQNKTECSSCHGNSTETIENVINKRQADTHTKWNATNITVQSALSTINAYTGEKNISRDKIAKAYWNLRLVSSDASWGVHNPQKVNDLLNVSSALANDSVAALGCTINNICLLSDLLNKTTLVGVHETFILSITNMGTATDNYTLVVDNPDGATTANLSASRVLNLSAGAKATVLLNVTNAIPGTFRVNVTAANSTIKASVNTTTSVIIRGMTWNVNAGGETPDMAMTGEGFYPGIITINAGDSINWTLGGQMLHVVAFLSGALVPNPGSPAVLNASGGSIYNGSGIMSSGLMIPGMSYSLTFTTPGIYTYQCLIHPGMGGIVIVNNNGSSYPFSQAQYNVQGQMELQEDLIFGQNLADNLKLTASEGTNNTTVWHVSADIPLPTNTSVSLSARNNSTATGNAELFFVGPGSLKVNLSVSGLVPNSIHPVNIYKGTCEATGDIAFQLSSLTAGSDGNATSTTIITGLPWFAIPSRGWFINVHSGPTMSGSGAFPIACGNVSKHNAAYLRFTPQNLTIQTGDTIDWTQLSSIEIHTVTFPAEGMPVPDFPSPIAFTPTSGRIHNGTGFYNSGVLNPGDSYNLTFTRPGSYNYLCLVHDQLGMVGRVDVVDVALKLDPGWNLISVPFELSNKTLFAGTSVVSALYYNASMKQIMSVIDSPLEPLKSYWVNNSASGVISLPLSRSLSTPVVGGGGVPTRSIPLASGWNMIGYTGNNSTTPTNTMLGSLGDGYWSVADYNRTTDNYDFYYRTVMPPVSSLEMKQKVGYWVYTTRSDLRYAGYII